MEIHDNYLINTKNIILILNYTFVKAQPTRIYSNAKFMEIYIGERKSQNEGSKLAQLLSICSYVSNLDYSQFSRDVNLSSFKMTIFRGALENLGYKIEQSYYDPNLFKTDAPVNYDILKQ